MGISVGWEDVYDKMLVGQNFDVTDLMRQPQARYLIRQTVDEAGIIFEQNDANNITSVWVTWESACRTRSAARDQACNEESRQLLSHDSR
jgi:hypothetical protein